MNKFFPVLSLIHRSTDCFCRKIRNHQFYNNISITRKKFLFGSIFGFAFCLDLFGSIFGLLSVWICLDLFGSVCILFGSVWICLDLFGSVWICLDLFGSVWICLDLFGSVWICLNLFGSVWTRLDLLGSVWKFLDLFYLFRSALINLICFDETSETTVHNL